MLFFVLSNNLSCLLNNKLYWLRLKLNKGNDLVNVLWLINNFVCLLLMVLIVVKFWYIWMGLLVDKMVMVLFNVMCLVFFVVVVNIIVGDEVVNFCLWCLFML